MSSVLIKSPLRLHYVTMGLLPWTRVFILQTFISYVICYYVPGTYPQEYNIGDSLQAQVGSLSSFETELPLEYYSLPVCKPPEGVARVANSANPGTILMGQRVETSPYNFSMKVKQTGQLVCRPDGYYGPLSKKEVKDLKQKIDKHYRINMILDNLPVTVYDLLDEDQEFVRPGFELGYKENGKYYVYNHLVFNILTYQTHGEYTAAKDKYKDALALEGLDTRKLRKLLADNETVLKEMYMVVGFEVSPCSILREPGKDVEDIVCGYENDARVTPQEVVEGAKIVYTYDVYWQDSKIKWASRWDHYLRMPGGKVHWFSILNSTLVVLVMAVIVAMILIRTVRKDLAKYESLVVDGNVDMKDEAGWKLVTGDVFRSPRNSHRFAVQVGSGVQIICTWVVTLLLATLGFLSPASRGALLTTTMVLYVWLALVAGFAAVYMWGLMERTYVGWPSVCGWVSIYYPGITMLIFTVLNIVIKHTGTLGAVPIGTYFSIVAVWFLVSIPLTFAGGYFAIRMPILDFPVKTNQIPRHIPPPPLAANPSLLFFAAGILPFGTLFIELYFAMTSLWGGYFYYLFGFIFIIGTLTVIINAEISVICTYAQLCAEDYHWWWSSFYRGGSVAMYISLYALAFLASSLSSLTGFMSVFIYLCYMTILILAFYFAMGTIGFVSSFWFVYTIFRAVKAD